MHKSNNSFRTSISIAVAILMAFTLITPMAMPARASSVDASVGLDFSNAASTSMLVRAPVGSSHTYRSVLTGVDAIVTVVELTNHENDRTSSLGLDVYDTSSTLDRWIRTELDRKNSGAPARKGFRIDFVASSDNSRAVVLDNLRLNAYDIDNAQFVEISNVLSYQLTSDTIVNQVENLGGNVFRFTSAAESAQPTTGGGPHSYGEARVQVNFSSTSTLTLVSAIINSGGSQDFDFSTSGLGWSNSSGPISAPSAVTPSQASQNSGGVSSPPQKQHVSTLNRTPAAGETVAMFGAYFGGVTEVFVGGVKVDIISKADNTVTIRMPRGLTGALDVELKSPLGTLLLPKHFTIGNLPAVGTRQATIIVGGFGHNSRKLTPRMQARIDRWLERNSDLSTLTCTGFTSLPRRTTDVELSTNRGITACAYSKGERPEVTTSVSQGIEDPRPGSNVRRVRLVLTP